MSIVYSENFEAYAVDTTLITNPPNYDADGSSGSFVVKTGLVGKCAQNPTIVSATWAHAAYNGASFTYTDLSIRCKRGGVRNNIFSRVSDVSSGLPVGGYQIQLTSGLVQLYRDGYAEVIGSWAGNPADINNYVARLLADGSNISVYIDGVLRIGPISDGSYASGKVGIGTFGDGGGGTDALWDDITVDDGSVPASGAALSDIRRRR